MNLKVLLSTFCLLIVFTVHAQKLPNIQQNSLRAPLNVKVDGNPKEWGNKFQAYNHATDVFYTMANDDDNLYLVVQTDDPKIISRIMDRGIRLSVQKTKGNKNGVNITYPITKTTLYFGLQRKKYLNEDTSAKAIDSVIKRHNKMIDDSCKLIRVNGIPGMDSLISVFNREGIKARAQFNNKKAFTCEFCVRLKLLNIQLDKITKITYHITVNGNKPMEIPANLASIVNGHEVIDEKFNTSLNDFIAKRSAPTDFWGEYTLVKK